MSTCRILETSLRKAVDGATKNRNVGSLVLARREYGYSHPDNYDVVMERAFPNHRAIKVRVGYLRKFAVRPIWTRKVVELSPVVLRDESVGYAVLGELIEEALNAGHDAKKAEGRP